MLFRSPGPLGGAWLCWPRDTEVNAKGQKRHWCCAWVRRSCQDPRLPRHPFPLQESLEDANVELCLHVCLFSFALPAQKRGPTGGKEGGCVCVCARARVRACCAGLGLRGSRKGDESTHTRLPPTACGAGPGAGAWGREPVTSCHLSELLPLLLGSGKVEKEGRR